MTEWKARTRFISKRLCLNCTGEALCQTPALFSSHSGVLPTDCEQALLYRVPLGLGEAAAFGQAVDGVQQGVDERGEGLRPRKQRRTFGEQRQHSGTQIPVEGKCHVCRTEGSLEHGVAGRQRESVRLIGNIHKISAKSDIRQTSWNV